MKPKKNKKTELNISGKEFRNLRRKVATRKPTTDLVQQARAKLSDNKVNGPEDAIVSETIKKVARGEECTLLRSAFKNDSMTRWIPKVRGRF